MALGQSVPKEINDIFDNSKNNIQDNNSLVDSISTNLNQNTTLKRMGIDGNNLSQRNIDDINTILERNRSIGDVISDYTKSILVPKLVQSIYGSDSIPENVNGQFRLEENMEMLRQKTSEYLLHGLNVEQIEKFSEHWHQPLQQIKSNKSKDYSGIEWQPLLGTKEIDIPEESGLPSGWKIIARTNHQELTEEGKQLNHCVGGYSGSCITGNSHILSVVSPTGMPQSTIEIETNYSPEYSEVTQHFGNQNSEIEKDSPSDKALSWLMDKIIKNELPINYEHLCSSRTEIMRSADTLEKRSILDIGFNPLNMEKYNEISSLYRDDMLPPAKENPELRDLLKNNLRKLESLSFSLNQDGKLVIEEPRELSWVDKQTLRQQQPNTNKDLIAIKSSIAELLVIDAKLVRVGPEQNGGINVTLPGDGLIPQESLKEILGSSASISMPSMSSSGNFTKLTITGQTPSEIKEKLATHIAQSNMKPKAEGLQSDIHPGEWVGMLHNQSLNQNPNYTAMG